jgi:hypothetical protein
MGLLGFFLQAPVKFVRQVFDHQSRHGFPLVWSSASIMEAFWILFVNPETGR